MTAAGPACRACDRRAPELVQLGGTGEYDHLVALAGNPNTGKSTVFNALTGLRQHTGNWPGKTVTRAEGRFEREGARYGLVDLPGTYSLQAASADEEVARDFLLFGQPDVAVVVVDATHLERNLNLVLQILEITDRVVVCLNLMDEARRHGVVVDPARLSRELGVPVVPTVARSGEGIEDLVQVVARVARGALTPTPFRLPRHEPEIQRAVGELEGEIERAWPGLSNARWIALRLLDADERIEQAIRGGELGSSAPDAAERVLRVAGRLRWTLTPEFHDRLMAGLYREAERIARAVLRARPGSRAALFNRTLDGLLTSRWLGFPLMLAVLAVVFWLTIAGANVPSQLLAGFLIDGAHPALKTAAAAVGMPAWLDGLLVDGVYLATAWVVSVMLPPMAIFFPLFTLLEDFGYLPRVAFNLDALFRRAGAHGKQALTMCMGFGCNAAGVVATRVIDSPRERLIAIITNNFSLCNGRWPTQILMATIFLGALVPAHLAGLVSATAVVGIALLGVAFMFATSWALSRTVLKGEASAFSLELPPYRPPRVLQTLYTSLIDRTLIVLWRAVVFAAPAGAVIWLIANVRLADASLAAWAVQALDPMAVFLGLNGIILLAYVVAIPANEIVIPTVLMLTVLLHGLTGVGPGAGVMFELDTAGAIAGVLEAGGWTLLTGVNLMLFSLLHNPCSTTLYTVYRETRSVKWTALAGVLPLGLGAVVCFLVAQIWRVAAG